MWIIKRIKRFLKSFGPERWLFLDDSREPPLHLNRLFDIVRSYDEFVEYIETYGVPVVISLDHDLHPEHTSFFFERGGFKNPPNPHNEIFKFKTGYDCAVWLVDYCEKNDKKLRHIFVHSHNPHGQRNIYNVIAEYQKKKYGTIKCKIIKWKHPK